MPMNGSGESLSTEPQQQQDQHKDDGRNELRSSGDKYCVRRPLFGGQVSAEQQFITKFKRSLGNMNPSNSDTVTPQLVESFKGVKDQLIWKESTRAILQRAMMDPNIVNTYLVLCAKLAHHNTTLYEENGQDIQFGYVMTLVFEEEMKQRLERPCTDNEEQQANKTKLLAATKFIGDLAKKNIVDPCLLLRPVGSVTNTLDVNNTAFTFSDQLCIECACTLLNMVGKQLDFKEDSSKTDAIYSFMAELGENKNLVARTRFMAKDLAELRQNKWFPRALTKKLEESSANSPSNQPTPQPFTSFSPAIALPLLNDPLPEEQDPELQRLMESLATKLKGMSEKKAASVFRKFTKTISTDHAKVLAAVLSDTPDSAVAEPMSPWSRKKALFRRTAGATAPGGPPGSPPTLSRNFHAAINLIKLSDSESFSEEMGSSLLTKVDTLQASELTELVGSIFRKMCENPGNYVFCLVLVTRLSNEADSLQFKNTLEACCQDESAMKMFSTQGALNQYMKLLKDLRVQLHTGKEVIKSCINKIQHCLFELSDEEMTLLSELEKLCGSTQFTYTSGTNSEASNNSSNNNNNGKPKDLADREIVQCG